MIRPRELGWRYWAVIDVLLWAGLLAWPPALLLALAAALGQIVHYRLREGRAAAFPVQVRSVYAAILAAGLWPPLVGLLWFAAVGTLAQVLFGYCFLARLLSLAAWNRAGPPSWAEVARTFLSPPVAGNVLQGQAPLPPAGPGPPC